MAERFQQFGTLYGDLHRQCPFTSRTRKVARPAGFGKAGRRLPLRFP
jgi:hypothetical protein